MNLISKAKIIAKNQRFKEMCCGVFLFYKDGNYLEVN